MVWCGVCLDPGTTWSMACGGICSSALSKCHKPCRFLSAHQVKRSEIDKTCTQTHTHTHIWIAVFMHHSGSTKAPKPKKHCAGLLTRQNKAWNIASKKPRKRELLGDTHRGRTNTKKVLPRHTHTHTTRGTICPRLAVAVEWGSPPAETSSLLQPRLPRLPP